MCEEGGDFTFDAETKAVIHLVHAWLPRGRSDEVSCALCAAFLIHMFFDQASLVPSADILGLKTANGQKAVCKFFAHTSEVRVFIRETLKAVVNEEEFARYERTFKTGRFIETDRVGPFLGVVCVYKCQVGLHQDSKDGDLCFITNVGAYRQGGKLFVPQLGLTLA